MEIIVPLHVKVCLSDDETVPIEYFVRMLRDQRIEALLLERILNAADEQLVISMCGEKYSRQTGNERFKRAGTSERKIVTSFGPMTLKMHRILNVHQNQIKKPLTDLVQFSGKRMFQPDILMIVVDFAQKLSYRDTEAELALVLPKVPSRTIIHRHVRDTGESIELNDNEEYLPVVMADGTKSSSQEPGVKQNEINVVLGVKDGRKTLLGVTVNQSWKAMVESLNTAEALSEISVVVSDGEQELRAAFAHENVHFQTDLIHGFRILGYKLWEDGALNLNQRKEAINDLKVLLLSLKNVVVFHKSENDRIGEKINQVVNGMELLANRLDDLGCSRSAKFLNTFSNTLVTFARLSINGIDIPWNSNMIERLMGEISKRVKHKWMRWSTRGLEAILRLILVRYTSPWVYNAFRNEKMGYHCVSTMTVLLSLDTVSR